MGMEIWVEVGRREGDHLLIEFLEGYVCRRKDRKAGKEGGDVKEKLQARVKELLITGKGKGAKSLGI